MLESLGTACRWASSTSTCGLRQERTSNSAIGLGLMLTLLFFHKYNYWLLMLCR